jgi:hypothetical protein
VLARFQAAKFDGGNLWRGWETPRRKDAKTQGREGLEKERKKERKRKGEQTKSACAAGGRVPRQAIIAAAICET